MGSTIEPPSHADLVGNVEEKLAAAMRSQVRWHCLEDELNPFIRWNSVRPLIEWYNGYRINNYISGELDKRFATCKASVLLQLD